MPSALPLPVRQVILRRWQEGESVASLADDLQLSQRTVRHLVCRFDQRGQEGLVADYSRCATKKTPRESAVFQKAVEMRKQHPTWGGGLIRVLLNEAEEASPSERTLQRWFRLSQLSVAPPGRRPASDEPRACRPHDVWQMDAVDQLRLGNGQRASWLRLVDECSGAVLQTTIFPPTLLESGRTEARARDAAPGFYAVGKALPLPGRQWRSLGIER
jgi:transposase